MFLVTNGRHRYSCWIPDNHDVQFIYFRKKNNNFEEITPPCRVQPWLSIETSWDWPGWLWFDGKDRTDDVLINRFGLPVRLFRISLKNPISNLIDRRLPPSKFKKFRLTVRFWTITNKPFQYIAANDVELESVIRCDQTVIFCAKSQWFWVVNPLSSPQFLPNKKRIRSTLI